MNFLRSIARQNVTILVAVLAVVGLREFSGCTRQLTVEEADAAVVTSCMLLSQALTADHPERLDQIVAQVCQPGRTRTLIENILSRGAPAPSTEFLDLDFPSGTLAPVPLPPESLESDAGVLSRRGAP